MRPDPPVRDHGVTTKHCGPTWTSSEAANDSDVQWRWATAKPGAYWSR
jgi:hypothetical protein